MLQTFDVIVLPGGLQGAKTLSSVGILIFVRFIVVQTLSSLIPALFNPRGLFHILSREVTLLLLTSKCQITTIHF